MSRLLVNGPVSRRNSDLAYLDSFNFVEDLDMHFLIGWVQHYIHFSNFCDSPPISDPFVYDYIIFHC